MASKCNFLSWKQGFQVQFSQLKKTKKKFSNAVFSAEHRGGADQVPWRGHPGWTVPCPLYAGKNDFQLDLTFHYLFINLSTFSRLKIQRLRHIYVCPLFTGHAGELMSLLICFLLITRFWYLPLVVQVVRTYEFIYMFLSYYILISTACTV